jgi:hypothetical protein
MFRIFRRREEQETIPEDVSENTLISHTRLSVRAVLTRADGTTEDLGEIASSDDNSAYLITDEDSI